MILQIPNVLDWVSCTRLIATYNMYRSRSQADTDYNGKPVVRSNIAMDEASKMLMGTTARMVLRRTREWQGRDDIYLETVILSLMDKGDHHRLHADNAKPESGQWVPNHTPNRSMTAMVYLNEEFDGGEIVFPQHAAAIKPSRGLYVAFPSDKYHQHLVRAVSKGQRYAMSVWMTDNKQFELGRI